MTPQEAIVKAMAFDKLLAECDFHVVGDEVELSTARIELILHGVNTQLANVFCAPTTLHEKSTLLAALLLSPEDVPKVVAAFKDARFQGLDV